MTKFLNTQKSNVKSTSNNDRQHMMKLDTRITEAPDKIKKLLLCKGQIIGEDLLLEKIKTLAPIVKDAETEELEVEKAVAKEQPQEQFHIICNSMNSILISANVEDIYRLLKKEIALIQFLDEQNRLKYPDKNLAESFFSQIIRNNKF